MSDHEKIALTLHHELVAVLNRSAACSGCKMTALCATAAVLMLAVRETPSDLFRLSADFNKDLADILAGRIENAPKADEAIDQIKKSIGDIGGMRKGRPN